MQVFRRRGTRRVADPAYFVSPDRIGIKTAWTWAAHSPPNGRDNPYSQAPEPRFEQLVGANGLVPRLGRAASPPALHHSAPSPFHPRMWPAQGAIGDSRERLPRIPIPGLNPADAWTRSYCKSSLRKASSASLRTWGSGCRAMIHVSPDRAFSSPRLASSIASASRLS